MAHGEFPPSYTEATGEHASPIPGVSFVDFFPEKARRGGYELFSNLVVRANVWLTGNPQWEAKTCESVEQYGLKNTIAEREKMCRYICKSHRVDETKKLHYIRYLRLWLVPRTDPSRPPQQIGYINVVPRCITGGHIHQRNYQTLDESIRDLNAKLQYEPLPGRVINVESQEVVIRKPREFDPDVTKWYEYTTGNMFLFVTRVFYEVGPPMYEVIGIIDFVPCELPKEEAVAKDQRYEPFSTLMSRTSAWCYTKSDVRFCNAQSVRVPAPKGVAFSSHRTYFECKEFTPVLTVLRVSYVADARRGGSPENSPHLQLTCKTIRPVCLRLWTPKYETLSETKRRMQAWVSATGSRILSAETVMMRMPRAFSPTCTDVTLNNDLRPYTDNYLYYIRLYFDGLFEEPPAEVLQSLPDTEEGCIIL